MSNLIGCSHCNNNAAWEGDVPKATTSPNRSNGSAVAATFKLEVLDLVGDFIKHDNKFTIQITKLGTGGAPEVIEAEVERLTVVVTQEPTNNTTASLTPNPISFVAAEDLSGDKKILNKQLTITPGETETTFSLQLQAGAVDVGAAITVKYSQKPNLQISLVSGKKDFIGDTEKQVTFAITTGGQDLSQEELQKITLAYQATPGAALKFKGQVAAGKNLAELLQVVVLPATASPVQLVLEIDNGGEDEVSFTDIQLTGTAEPGKAENHVPEITWASQKPDIKIQLAPGQSKDLIEEATTIKFTISAGKNKVTLSQLQSVTLTWDNSTSHLGPLVTLMSGNQPVTGQSLAALLHINELAARATKELVVNLYGKALLGKDSAPFKITNIKLAGTVEPDEAGNKVAELNWRPAPKVSIRLADGQKGDLKGDDTSVKFTITAAEGVDAAMLKRITFTYAPTVAHMGLAFKDKVGYTSANNKDLPTLLGHDSLVANQEYTLALNIAGPKGNKASFFCKDIKLVGSSVPPSIDTWIYWTPA